MVDNLKVAEQLKKMQESMNSLVEAQTKQLRSQANIVKEIVDSYASLNPQDTISNIENTKKALEQAAESAGKSKESSQNFHNLVKAVKEAANEQQKLEKVSSYTFKTLLGFATINNLFSGFVSGMKLSVDAMRMFSNYGMHVGEVLGQIAIGIISMPFKMLQSLINFAGNGGDNSLRQALEDIRKEWGHLDKSTSAAIISMSRKMKGELANTGLSVYRVFGNLAEKLKFVAEYAKNVGPLFANLAMQFVANAEAVGAYFKGLGLTEEGQRGVATRAFALGQEITEVTRQMTNYSLQVAHSFGLSAKEVSRDVGNMMNSFEQFGGMAPKVLTQISVYARRLGVEVKALLGTIDKFDNFEDAAKSAAHLTQAFGLQIDALEMLKEQDPAARTEMMRKAFFAAGRSIENMTRQERALLQQQTGLEASALDLVFSAKNQAMTYDQVRKKSQSAEKSQLTQAEALHKLSGAIERLVKNGNFGAGGFFERFFQGMELGIVRSHEFRKLMINLRMALRTTYFAGVQVGRLFVEHFPGVKKFFGGLADLFSPQKFRKIRNDLVNIFGEFFKALSGGSGKAAFPTLLKNLKRMFFDYFDSSTESGRGILEGAKSFLRGFVTIISGVLKEGMKGITQGITFITDLLSGKQSLSSFGANPNSFMGFVMQLVEPLMEAFKEAWPGLVKAMEGLFEQVWPRVANLLRENAGTIVTILFGPAMIRSVMSGLVFPFASIFAGAMMQGWNHSARSVKNFLKNGFERLTGSSSGDVSQKTVSSLANTVKAVDSTGEVAKAAQRAPINAATVGRMALIGLVLAVGMMAIVAGIVGLAHYIKTSGLSTRQLLTSAGVMTTAGLVMVELAAAVALVSVAGTAISSNMQGALIGIGAVAAVGALMTVGIISMVQSFADIEPSRLNSTISLMAAGGAFILAATGVLAAATAVGALFIGTYGLGAAAAVVGLAAIASTTQLMIEQIKLVVTEVGKMRINNSFRQNFEIFTTVLEAISSFGSMVASISSSTSHSSAWSWFTGSGSTDHIKTLDAVKSTIRDMADVMREIVSTVIHQVSSLNTAPSELQKAELFGNIMNTLGTVVKNFQPPESLFQNEGLFKSRIDTRLRALGSFFERMSGALKSVIESVVSSFSDVVSNSSFTENARHNFAAIGEILNIIGGLGRSLMIVINQQYSGLSGSELQQRIPQVAQVITGLMATLFASGTNGLLTTMSELIRSMVGAISSLSARDAQRLSGAAPMLTKAFEAISQIGLTVANLGSMISDIPSDRKGAALGTLKAIVGTMLYGIRDVVSGMVESTKNLFSGLSPAQVNALKSGVQTVQQMIEAISRLPETLSSLVSSLGDGEFNYTRIRQRLGTIVSLFYNQDNQKNPGLPVLFREAANAFNSIPELNGNPAAKLETLTKSLNSIAEISTINFENVANSITSNADVLKAGAFTRMGENIKTMVAEVNSISADLGRIRPVEINTQLKALGNRLGLGSNEEITIRNRDFNITVNLEVKVDAEELETVLIRRPNSHILSR